MGRTIIQPIGPLYGEAVNGTVFGRPNGSIYIPDTNTITISSVGEYIRNNTVGGNTVASLCNAGGNIQSTSVVARAQDNLSIVQIQVSDDPDFATFGRVTKPAGQFNITQNSIATNNVPTITNGTTYYVRAVLFSSTSVIVAVSNILEVTGVEP